jgi:hypothetical protein
MSWVLTKALLIVLGLSLLQPVVARADDDDWKEDKYWEHEHEARKKALEREYEARKKDLEREHEWRKKAEEYDREARKKAEEYHRERRQKEREAEEWHRGHDYGTY